MNTLSTELRLKLEPTDDDGLTCWFCQGDGCDLEATFLVTTSPGGTRRKTAVGFHQRCVELAMGCRTEDGR